MDKATRMAKLLPRGRGVWIPIDHGASDYPIPGLTDTEGVIRSLIAAGAVSYTHLTLPTKDSV